MHFWSDGVTIIEQKTRVFHVTYLSEGKRIISFKNPQNPNPARPPSSIRPLNLHHMSCLHCRGSLHQPTITLPPCQCGLHLPQILHHHSPSQTLALMSLPQTSAKPQPLFQIFHHTSKFHLNFTHNYETYLTTIRLSTLQTCQILNFPISLNSSFEDLNFIILDCNGVLI